MLLNQHETESWWMEQMLNKANMVTSYKAYWLMAIVDLVIEHERSTIDFSEVVNRMIVSAWYPVITYKLSLGHQDRLSTLVVYLKESYPDLNTLSKDKLLKFISLSDQLSHDKLYQAQKKNLYQMVPYRLLSPFFKEATRNIKDQKKNRLIVELSNSSYESLYTINERTLMMREHWMIYIKRNQALLKGWIKYKLVQYLQARNPNVPNILLKLDPPSKRDLSDSTKLWKSISKQKMIHDIYSGQLMDQSNYKSFGNMSIDHFIPWSFVGHDELWNLCPTFKNINSSKSDALPSLDKYLGQFCKLQTMAINHIKGGYVSKKILEDYFTINDDHFSHQLHDSDHEVEAHVVEVALKKMILPLHQIALNQGFDRWEKLC